MTDAEKLQTIKTLIESVRDYASSHVLLTRRNVLALCDRIMSVVEDD